MTDYHYLGGAYWVEKDEGNISINVSWLTEQDILGMDDAFGTLHDYSADIIARENPYLFTGREYDWQTGLYYYRARSYSSALGRFLQRDPEGMVDGANMYVYCGNDPVNKNDPYGTGFWCKFICGAIWALIGIAVGAVCAGMICPSPTENWRYGGPQYCFPILTFVFAGIWWAIGAFAQVCQKRCAGQPKAAVCGLVGTWMGLGCLPFVSSPWGKALCTTIIVTVTAALCAAIY